jgi:monofunctional biosynthetic peptidoglycan transglycosylase
VARQPSAPRKSSRSRTSKRGWILRLFVWTLVFLIFFPMLEVLAVRYIDPPGTPLMLIRRMEGRVHPGAAPQRAYRWTPLQNVSPHFLKAVWQTEDARFFAHNGFDWVEVSHAMADAERSGEPARGASTITMQCARSLFLWQGRSWIRKPLEAYYTILMETMLTKRRIFELYVNVIETGDGLYGVEAAAQHYWRRSAKELTTPQAVLLTAILPNPRQRNPLQPSPKVRKRAAMIDRKLRESPRWPL